MASAAQETILLLEEIAANAVAAEVTQMVGGWLLRAWPGVPFRRANAVLPIRGDASDLDARIALVEDFYHRRELPVRYQMQLVAAPPELDGVLAARGYEVEATSLVQTADARAVAAATSGDDALEVTLVEAVDESWLAANADAHGTDDGSRRRVAAYGRLLGRLGPDGAAVVARAPDRGAAGAGFVVASVAWLPLRHGNHAARAPPRRGERGSPCARASSPRPPARRGSTCRSRRATRAHARCTRAPGSRPRTAITIAASACAARTAEARRIEPWQRRHRRTATACSPRR